MKLIQFTIKWRGITVQITWHPDWLGAGYLDLMELKSDHILPVSESGYRSIFFNWFGGNISDDDQDHFRHTTNQQLIQGKALDILESAALEQPRKWGKLQGSAIPFVSGKEPKQMELF